MNKLLNYLIRIDELAADLYSQAVGAGCEDLNISELFRCLQKSRIKNRDTLAAALKDHCAAAPSLSSAPFTKQLKEECSVVFNKAAAFTQNPAPTAKELLEFTIEIELTCPGRRYSEAVDALREGSRTFISVAAGTQWRRRLLESYIINSREYTTHLRLFQELPRIWTENLLVADDSAATTTLLADTLSGEGSVYTAGNGVSAMDKLNEKYFAAIISDVSMPLMGGVDLYRSAEKRYPGIGRRFIFFTDTASMEDIDFFKINKINYLPKPSPIIDIRRAVLKVLGDIK
ncbi:hypothetical protein MNBD_DELTA01-2120 [hydrothermal vent metagenome]|uniref:Response regulatory domain-containing protein n=1 Tax=hydrothermal vent metagenome TaxID=652676 RepID=A0A3B0QU68_9ZZZZ